MSPLLSFSVESILKSPLAVTSRMSTLLYATIDAPLKVKQNLANQRKKLVREQLDLNEPIVYDDKMDDNYVWVN